MHCNIQDDRVWSLEDLSLNYYYNVYYCATLDKLLTKAPHKKGMAILHDGRHVMDRTCKVDCLLRGKHLINGTTLRDLHKTPYMNNLEGPENTISDS